MGLVAGNSISILYLSVAVVDLLAKLIQLRWRIPSKQVELDIIIRHITTPGRLTRITQFLLIPQVEVAWPVLIKEQILFSERTSDLEFIARLQLRPVDIRMAGFNPVVLAAVAVMGTLNLVWHILILLIVLAVLVAIVARHVTYFLGTLPERFRRSVRNPYGSYVILAACDAVSLLLCITLLHSSSHQLHLTWPIAKTSALDLFTLRQIPEIPTLKRGDALVSLIGLLFYSAILKTIFDRAQFKRTDDDLRALAASSVVIADFGKARKWLSEEEQRTAASYTIRAMIELGSGDFHKAEVQVRNNLRLSDRVEDPDSVSQSMSGLTLSVPMSLELRVSYLKYTVSTYTSDVLTLMAIDQTILGPRQSNQPALDLSNDAKEFASQLLDACSEQDYPLARARLMTLKDDWGEAIGILE